MGQRVPEEVGIGGGKFGLGKRLRFNVGLAAADAAAQAGNVDGAAAEAFVDEVFVCYAGFDEVFGLGATAVAVEIAVGVAG